MSEESPINQMNSEDLQELMDSEDLQELHAGPSALGGSSEEPTIQNRRSSISQALQNILNLPRSVLGNGKKENAKQIVTGDQPSHIWRVPLRQSITYANVAISLQDAQGKSYIYGYVPIVVAKCGVYLKEHGESNLARFQNRMTEFYSDEC